MYHKGSSRRSSKVCAEPFICLQTTVRVARNSALRSGSYRGTKYITVTSSKRRKCGAFEGQRSCYEWSCKAKRHGAQLIRLLREENRYRKEPLCFLLERSKRRNTYNNKCLMYARSSVTACAALLPQASRKAKR